MQVKREHLAGLELALDEMHDMLDGDCESRLNRLIEQAKAAPVEEYGAEAVEVVGYLFKLHSGVYSQMPGHEWEPLMTVAQHHRLNRLIEQVKAAPFITGADVVAFVKGDEAHRVISWHPDKPAFAHPVGTELMTVAQHSQIMADAKADANLYRQWFNAVQDLNPKYLEAADYAAAARLEEQ